MTDKWSQPKALYMTIIICSLAAAVQFVFRFHEFLMSLTARYRGWDQTGSNGANLSFPQVFNIDTDPTKDPRASRNQWLVGVINSGCDYPQFHELALFNILYLPCIALTLALPSLAAGLQTLLTIILVVVGLFSSVGFFVP
jgi:hypothetical protein